MWTEIITAAATVAVAWTAIQSLRRERRQDEAQRKAVDARISAEAYTLRRQVRSWWNHTWPGRDKDKREKARELVRHFDSAEERIENLLALAPEASPEIADAVRKGAVRFYRGTKFINETAAADWEDPDRDDSGRLGNPKLARDVSRQFDRSWGLLRECVELLDEAVDPKLQAAQKEIEK